MRCRFLAEVEVEVEERVRCCGGGDGGVDLKSEMRMWSGDEAPLLLLGPHTHVD